VSPQQLELITYIACTTLGFSLSQLLVDAYEMRRIRKAVERFADDFAKEVRR
jgi:hypothetical protein